MTFALPPETTGCNVGTSGPALAPVSAEFGDVEADELGAAEPVVTLVENRVSVYRDPSAALAAFQRYRRMISDCRRALDRAKGLTYTFDGAASRKLGDGTVMAAETWGTGGTSALNADGEMVVTHVRSAVVILFAGGEPAVPCPCNPETLALELQQVVVSRLYR